MRKRVYVKDLYQHAGQKVTLGGWIHSIRRQGKITFILLRDRTGIVQIAAESDKIKPLALHNETVVYAEGKVVKDHRASGGIEVRLASLKIVSAPEKPLPILVNDKADYQKLEIETLLNNRVLSLRNPKRNAIFRLQADIIDCFRSFMRDEGFTEVTTPKIIATGTEGGTQLFSIDYFDKLAYLAQSPQFYKQMLVGAGYERVDYEMGFIEDEHDIMDVEERFIKTLFSIINGKCGHILRMYGRDLPVPEKIPRIPVSEACSILESEYGKKTKGFDLDPEGEKLICEWTKKEHDCELLFLTEYPRSKRPVYTMPIEENTNFTRSFDLLFRGLEITTGGQRIHDYTMLLEAFDRRGLDASQFEYYTDTFAYGMPPHGGLAIGLERITAQILGLSNIREASIFPRDRGRIVPELFRK